jgi:hypothetical protein
VPWAGEDGKGVERNRGETTPSCCRSRTFAELTSIVFYEVSRGKAWAG